MLNLHMKRRALDGDTGPLQPEAHLRKDIVDETLFARVVGQPVQDVAVGICGSGIDVRRRVHILLQGRALRRMSCLGGVTSMDSTGKSASATVVNPGYASRRGSGNNGLGCRSPDAARYAAKRRVALLIRGPSSLKACLSSLVPALRSSVTRRNASGTREDCD